MLLSRLSIGNGTGEGGSRTRALPGTGHSSANCSHPLAVSSVQSEPQGDGTALPSGDSLHSMWVFCARRESHGPSALGLHLCLKGTKRGVHRTETITCLQKGHGVIQVQEGMAPLPGFPKTRAKENRRLGRGPLVWGGECWPPGRPPAP